MADEGLSVSVVSEAVRSAGASWEAGETAITALPREGQLRRLGATPPSGVPSVAEMARRPATVPGPAAAARAVGAPVAFDLRNVNGGNYVTPVKDQGGCGACVAFGVAAAVETQLRWQRRSPTLAVDLSEAQLFFCYARSEGRNCGNGWWPSRALPHVQNSGVADETCFPYTDRDQDCSRLCADWAARAVKISGFTALTNQPAQMKEWLSTRGALSACFVVFDDFFAYRGGVYRHVTGNEAGGHCVTIIGYDDAAGCWICKNSWGPGWGEGGFFRIGYGQCSIEAWEVHGINAIAEARGGWASQGGVITSNIATARNADGRLEIFARGTDNALWHKWQTAPNNGWSGWSSLGGVITSDAVVAQNADGRLEVFARGTDNAVWHRWQTAPSNGWSGWSSLGGVITSNIATARNADGRLEIFARGTDNALWHRWQTARNNGWSPGWASLGGAITSDAAVAQNADGRLEVFVRGTDNAVWHRWQTAPSNGWSPGWASLGGVITSNIATARNADGRLEIFARGTNNALWHRWQTARNNGWSPGWASLGGVITSDTAVAQNADGRLEVFVRGTDNAVWHRWQTAPSNGWSPGWASLGGVITSNIATARNADGRIEVFVRGTDRAVWHRWQTAPNNGWS